MSLKNTGSIPLHRVAVLRPFANFLADIGAPVERGFRQAGLPVDSLDDINNYIPSHRFWSFLIDMAHREGMPSLGFHVGQKYGGKCADPRISELLRRAPTIYQGLSKACELINRTISNCEVGLVSPAQSQFTCFYHSPSCDAHNLAIHQIGWFGVMTLIGIVRECIGPHWQPAEIGLMTDCAPSRDIRDQFPGTRIRLLQPFSYITLESALLSRRPLGYTPAEPVLTLLHGEGLPKDFIGSVTKVLHSYIHESDLSLQLTAELCGISKRSLQRKLKKTGTHYSDILENVRFDVACDMLQKPEMNVTDIAHTLGYSDSSHFSRAFRRISGINPKSYRKQQEQ